MLLDKKKAIYFAEKAKWDDLKKLITNDPKTAKQVDDYGMLPIHWACTESNVPLDVLEILLNAYPESAKVRTNVNLLPIHIAVRSICTIAWLKKILEAYPEAILEKTGNGRSVVDFARHVGLPSSSLRYLIT